MHPFFVMYPFFVIIGCTEYLKIGGIDTSMEIVNSQSTSQINIYETNGDLTSEGKRLSDIGKIGLSQNKFGVVILSGGQGSRLGSDKPKGLFTLCKKTLFEHHITKIKNSGFSHNIKIFIMTSDHTHEDVVSYFKYNKNFNLDVVFFKQNSFPCTYLDGTVIKINTKELKSPNGNGDIFKSINEFDLSDLYAINVISVDNVLAQILNPEFVGAFIENKLDILSKSITKLPSENVGVFVRNNGKLEVKEYSEMNIDQGIGCEGNICNHLFRTGFVTNMKSMKLPVHKATKKIPENVRDLIDRKDEEKCLKSELFIFDSFQFTEKNKVLSVPRFLEFAPLKNNMDEPVDNPETCEKAFMNFNEIRMATLNK